MIIKKYLKNVLIVLSGFIIILFSFFMPKLFFKLEDLSREKEIFAKAKKESKIDVEAEKIYLVRTIHDIYDFENKKITAYYGNGKEVVTSATTRVDTGNKSPTQEIKEEISKLFSSNILENKIDFNQILYYTERLNVFYKEYSVLNVSITIEEYSYLDFSIESKTGKIIAIAFNQESYQKNIEKSELLKNYVKYLDLDIIDDWKFEENVLKSEKAQLVVFFEESFGEYMITVASMEGYEEYNQIKNENEIAEKDTN